VIDDRCLKLQALADVMKWFTRAYFAVTPKSFATETIAMA
jgi:hypothetical protein